MADEARVERPELRVGFTLTFASGMWQVLDGYDVLMELSAREALKLGRKLGVEDRVRATIVQQAAYAKQEFRAHEERVVRARASEQRSWLQHRDRMLRAQADLEQLS